MTAELCEVCHSRYSGRALCEAIQVCTILRDIKSWMSSPEDQRQWMYDYNNADNMHCPSVHVRSTGPHRETSRDVVTL